MWGLTSSGWMTTNSKCGGPKITAMTTERQPEFHSHLERLLDHTELRAIQWINIARPVVRFNTIWKGKKGR